MNIYQGHYQLQVKSSDLSKLLEGFEQQVKPKAKMAIEELKGETFALAEEFHPNLALIIKLNLQNKENLLWLGTIYASFLANPEDIENFIFVVTRFGHWLTLIDTLLDSSGFQLTSDDYVYLPNILTSCIVDNSQHYFELIDYKNFSKIGQTAIELFCRLSNDIYNRLVKLENYHIFAPHLLKLLDRHSQLVTFQHLPRLARSKMLNENTSYEELCIHGSPGLILAILAKAVELKANFNNKHIENLVNIYLPEFGKIHVWVDDLIDIEEDDLEKDLNLVVRSEQQNFRLNFLDLFQKFLGRIHSLENQIEVIYPLMLMLQSYEKEFHHKQQTMTTRKSRELSDKCHQVLLEAITLLEGRIQQDA